VGRDQAVLAEQAATNPRTLCSATLVARSGDRATGLGRYSSSLERALAELGVAVRSGSLVDPIPKPLVRLLALIGRDAETFFGNYGLAASVPAADVYHLTNEYQAPLLTVRKLRPAVVTVNGFLTFFLRHQPELRMGGPLEALFDRLVIRGLRKADAVIAVSTYVKRQLVEQVGLEATCIRVIPEGVDTEFFSPRQTSAGVRSRYGLSADRRWILYVGSEQPRKNFVTLLHAFAQLRRTRPELALLKVGDPEVWHERERAISVARALGVLEHIRFVGHASETLPDLYSVANVFVFPSLCEGFGLPPLEAMACGTPVVCSNTSSLPEVVGDAAEMCEPNAGALADAMARVLDRPEYAHDLATRGRARARMLSWERTAQATAELYLELRAQHASRGAPAE
jgi:glycosyltransferase involved in cell wall biosynthesis